jgi:1-phosphofructokinase family hexose kinase
VVAVSNKLVGAVTLNLALDITYAVDELVVGGSHRVASVRQRAGGKGVNVARVARALGYNVLALGFAGGRTGELVEADLDESGLNALLTPIKGETRRSVAVVDTSAGDATVFNEPGPEIADDEWRALCDRMPWGRLGVLVCSGSLPPGLPEHAYAELAARARQHDVTAAIDTGGVALLAAAKAGAVVRANAAELRSALAGDSADTTATGESVGDADAAGGDEVVAGARRLVELGARAAVITDGAAGMVAVVPDAAWRALPVERVRGNPTGAGDACTAVVAVAVAEGNQDWPAVLRSAVAASAAAVLTPVAGDVDLEAYRRWLPQVAVQELSAPGPF